MNWLVWLNLAAALLNLIVVIAVIAMAGYVPWLNVACVGISGFFAWMMLDIV